MKKTFATVAAVVFVLCSMNTVFAELKKIDENVWSYLDEKEPTPQKSYGANAGIIIGKDGIVVVDTLTSAKTGKKFMDDIRKVSGKPIKYAVNTHSHFDHTFGNCVFEDAGTAIVAQENCKNALEKMVGSAKKIAMDYGLTDEDMAGSKVSAPSISFDRKMVIDLGEPIELIYIAPSHSPGSCLVYLPSKKILFAGDILFTDFHPFMGHGELAGWQKTLDYILRLDVEKIVPGHGPLSTKKDVRDMKEYLLAFDTNAKKFAMTMKDPALIQTELLKVLPERSRGHGLIAANIQMRYLKK